MGRSKPYIQRGLDREVYQAVCKVLDNDYTGITGHDFPVSLIYNRIKKSNSSLARKSKVLLEDSISRIVEVIREEQGFDDSVGPDSLLEEEIGGTRGDAAVGQETETSNAMNISIRKSLASKSKSNIHPSNGIAHTRESSPSPAANTYQSDELRPSSKKRRAVSPSPSTMPKSSTKRYAKSSPRNGKARADPTPGDYAPPSHLSLRDLGGMKKVLDQLHNDLFVPLLAWDLYHDAAVPLPRGVLFHGPPGCGKTLLCQAIAASVGCPFLSISAPSIVSGMSGESEKTLRGHFEKAVSLAPCIVFIDEIDAITPKRESAQREMERRIVGQLLTCLDDLNPEKTNGKPVIVLAATNRPDSIDPALRREGRFETEINIGVPNADFREQIIRAQTRKMKLSDNVDFKELAKCTPGFVGADLMSLVRLAGKNMINRRMQEEGGVEDYATVNGQQSDVEMLDSTAMQRPTSIDDVSDPVFDQDVMLPNIRALDRLKARQANLGNQDSQDRSSNAINMSDFLDAASAVQPTAKREGFTTIPSETWASVGALNNVRCKLQSAIVKPIQHPEKYARFGIKAPAGVLLYGPPGCGKTLLAKAVANESRANFISVKGPELLNKYVGESERAVRQVFFRARASQPCVVFFDELDALVPPRDDSKSEASSRVVNTLLTELDGMGARTGIYVIAATNRPEMIDEAMLRPGRLGKHLKIDLPNPAEREEIFETTVKGVPVRVEDMAGLKAFARDCADFSGADLAQLVSDAATRAVERDAEFLEVADLVEVFVEMKPSVGVVKKLRS